MGSKKLKNKSVKDKDPASNFGMEDILADSRFAHIASDPRYRNISSKNLKVKVDGRFKSALKSQKFASKNFLDPRGKPKNYGTKEGLHKFYDLQSSSSDSDSSDDEEGEDDAIKESEGSDSHEDDDSDKEKKVIGKKMKKVKGKTEKSQDCDDVKEEFMASLLDPERDLARGEAFYSDDSSDDDSSTTDEEEEEFNEFEWGELDGDAIWDGEGTEVEETNRFAVCGLDWDNVKAVDLLVLFSSFKPSGSSVNRVTIYPSEFGKTRMAEEELKGPQELVRLTASYKKKVDDEYSVLEKLKKGTLDQTDKATEVEIEALRRYQRNRLKYFYAVVECDSVETANTIYKMCDRTYFEVIGSILDLRYIPNDMEFDEVPHDVSEQIPNSYKFDNLQSESMVQAKPKLSWDDTDRRRKKVMKTAMSQALKKEDIDLDTLNDFVGGSDSDEDEAEEEESGSEEEEGEGKEKKEARVAKFRALISEMEEKASKKCELTFDMEANLNSDEDERDSEKEADADSEKESDDNEEEELTPFEKILMKKKQKRKDRKLKIKEMKENKDKNNTHQNEEDENMTDEEMETKIKTNKMKKKKKLNKKDTGPKVVDNNLALLAMEEAEEEKKHFDMRKIKEQKDKMEKKKKKRKNTNEEDEEVVDDFKVNLSDPRFAALFTNGNFNVDPSHSQYDKHSSINKLIIQKQKKAKPNPLNEESQINNNSKMDSDISSMIKRVRMKTSKLK